MPTSFRSSHRYSCSISQIGFVRKACKDLISFCGSSPTSLRRPLTSATTRTQVVALPQNKILAKHALGTFCWPGSEWADLECRTWVFSDILEALLSFEYLAPKPSLFHKHDSCIGTSFVYSAGLVLLWAISSVSIVAPLLLCRSASQTLIRGLCQSCRFTLETRSSHAIRIFRRPASEWAT
jgi:hypothetical protein